MAWNPYSLPHDFLLFTSPAWTSLSPPHPNPVSTQTRRRRPRAIDNHIRDLHTSHPSSHPGDLGWTLDYATAWAFRRLVRHRPEIADAIARIRRAFSVVSRHTPFHIFPFLDRVLFDNKLGKSVYLVWKAQSLASPGVTRAGEGGSKISIELNRSPFEDPYLGRTGAGPIDVLLDQLIHQMIHAYFLVACGSQSKDEPHDGRLLDGLHFGVLLLAIWDIASRGPDGPLNLIFYAETRRRWSAGVPVSHVQHPLLPPFIALGPQPTTDASPRWTGSSQCTLDNRHIRHSDLRNWQVKSYAIALSTNLEGKGDTVFDYATDNKLEPVHRLQGPPSKEYVELIWEDRRIMVPRERACGFASLKEALEKNDRFELSVPAGCSAQLFALLYNFFLHGRTIAEEDEEKKKKKKKHRGAPAIVAHPRDVKEEEKGVLTHLRLFHLATAMEFSELQHHILDLLWTSFSRTTDPPIEILREVYGDDGPTHVDLHRWGRAFLLRRGRGGRSNYEVLCEYHGKDFDNLRSQNKGLKEDCRGVVAELRGDGDWMVPCPMAMRDMGWWVCHPLEMRGGCLWRWGGLGETWGRDFRPLEAPVFTSSEEDEGEERGAGEEDEDEEEDEEDENEIEGDDEEVWFSRRRRPRHLTIPPVWSEWTDWDYRRGKRSWRLVPM